MNAARILKIARLHLVAWPFLIAWPIGIAVVSFLITYAINVAVGDATTNTTNFSGGIASMFGFALAFYLQAMMQTFPFALGVSVTRREFFTATTLVAGVQSVGLGVLVYLAGLVERATNGWGQHIRMFDITRYLTENPVLAILANIVAVFLLAGIGLFLGALYQRWRLSGVLTTGTSFIVALGVAAIVITWQKWWTDIGHWFADIPRGLPLVVFPAALAVIALAAAWGVMRRAIP